MSDERAGLPSASAVESYQLCLGKWNAERQIPPEPDTEYSASGTRVHNALCGLAVELSDEEQDTADRCRAIESRVCESFFELQPSSIEREVRIWLFQDLRRVFSGKADYIARYGAKGLILDFKALWGDHTASPRNPQLRALAVLASEEYGLDEVAVAIVQPKASGMPELCVYSEFDLLQAKRELSDLLAAIKQPNAPRTPGEKQCQYCRAKMQCPEAQAAVAVIQPIGSSLATMTGPQLADFLGLCETAEQIIKAAKSSAKERLGKGEKIPGWELSPGKQKREVTDVQTVFSRVSSMGITVEEFTAICGLGLGDFEKLCRAASKRTGSELKGAALKSKVSELLDGCIEIKQSAKSLHRVGAALEDSD